MKIKKLLLVAAIGLIIIVVLFLILDGYVSNIFSLHN